jgi:hypothetical protein
MEKNITKENNQKNAGVGCLVLVLIIIGWIYFSNSGEPAVNWSIYSSDLKIRIDNYANQKDCKNLQKEFDIAFENSDGTLKRTGTTNNSALMNYIDFQLEKCNCK